MSASTTDEDAPLIAEIRRGNARAYGKLVERHQDRAYTFALRLLGRTHEAEEAVQDAFIRAYTGLAGFRGESRFSTWLTRILYNVCMTQMTRRRPAGPSLDELPEMERDRIQGAEPGPSPLDRLQDEELAAEVQAAVNNLPERYRTVVLLYYLQEEPFDRIADLLELPPGTVKTHLFRARALLRNELMKAQQERLVA